MSDIWRDISDFIDHNPEASEQLIESILIEQLHQHIRSCPGGAGDLLTEGLLGDLPRLQVFCHAIAGVSDVMLRTASHYSAWQATVEAVSRGEAGYGVGKTPGVAMLAALASLMMTRRVAAWVSAGTSPLASLPCPVSES